MPHRFQIMSTEVEAAIKKLTASYKGDHCALVRSACAFTVHVCQDEHRLFYQFFSMQSDELMQVKRYHSEWDNEMMEF